MAVRAHRARLAQLASQVQDVAPAPKRARKPRARPPPPDPWAPPEPAEVRARLGLPAVEGPEAAEATRLFERLGAVTEVTKEIGDARQSDAAGRGVLFTERLKKGTVLKDPGVAHRVGDGYKRLGAFDYVYIGGDGYMVLRDEENRVATRTFFVNEARDGKEATVAWRALRGREATCGQAVLWGWELVRDVAPGDEVLTTYEEDASGMPETRPDERSGTADALASIGGVPRNLQGCGYLVATAPRRAGAVDRSAGEEDRHLQIAVANSLRDAKHDKLRVPGCACRDLETGQRCKATRGGGSWYTITFGDGKTASRRAEQLEPLEDAEPAAAPVPAAAPPTPPPPAPAAATPPPPADAAAAPPQSSVSSDEAIALALQNEATPAPAAAAPSTPVAPAAVAPSTPVAEAPPAQPPIASAAEEVTAPVAMELEPAAAPAGAPELAELQELHGPLGAWYAASGLAHGAFPETPEGLAAWPAFGEMTERFLAATL